MQKNTFLIDNTTMRLRELREENKYTQSTVAEVLGVKQNTYSQYEKEVRQIPIPQLIKLAKFYSVSTDYILGISDY